LRHTSNGIAAKNDANNIDVISNMEFPNTTNINERPQRIVTYVNADGDSSQCFTLSFIKNNTAPITTIADTVIPFSAVL
jgi:hypothetical protein